MCKPFYYNSVFLIVTMLFTHLEKYKIKCVNILVRIYELGQYNVEFIIVMAVCTDCFQMTKPHSLPIVLQLPPSQMDNLLKVCYKLSYWVT